MSKTFKKPVALDAPTVRPPPSADMEKAALLQNLHQQRGLMDRARKDVLAARKERDDALQQLEKAERDSSELRKQLALVEYGQDHGYDTEKHQQLRRQLETIETRLASMHRYMTALLKERDMLREMVAGRDEEIGRLRKALRGTR